MSLICYVPQRFHGKSQKLIVKANEIIADYATQRLTLTLRQLYYRFVAANLIPNTLKEYKKLQSLINNARLAGLISWDAIEDRTRGVKSFGGESSPADAIRWAAQSYREDLWENQPNRVEVWVEKDALAGVIEQACGMYRTPFLSCRGYASQSEVWRASERFKESDKPAHIIHLGDHDPSGRDMTRDNEERVRDVFGVENFTMHRIALNIDQVKKYNPPPNPAKMTDTRADAYVAEFGKSSWELDALEPKVLKDLIQKKVASLIDFDTWDEDLAVETEHREELTLLSRAADYEAAITFLKGRKRK